MLNELELRTKYVRDLSKSTIVEDLYSGTKVLINDPGLEARIAKDITSSVNIEVRGIGVKSRSSDSYAALKTLVEILRKVDEDCEIVGRMGVPSKLQLSVVSLIPKCVTFFYIALTKKSAAIFDQEKFKGTFRLDDDTNYWEI